MSSRLTPPVHFPVIWAQHRPLGVGALLLRAAGRVFVCTFSVSPNGSPATCQAANAAACAWTAAKPDRTAPESAAILTFENHSGLSLDLICLYCET